ncbi:DUF6234 family protein [Streptomyces mayteni]
MTTPAPDDTARPADHAADHADRVVDRVADRVADIGGALGLLVLELMAMVAVFGWWVLSGWSLDPATPAEPDPVWGYLAAYAALGALMVWTARRAARRRVWVTASTQGLLALCTATLILVGAAGELGGERTSW